MTDVTDNKAESRFELGTDAGTAVAAYERAGDRIVFTHTVVPPELRGQGIGGRLIGAALDAARADGLRVVPQCPFVADYIAEHPDYAELVAD